MQIAQNQMLFSLLGTTYGGDARTTFALPDLRGRVPLNLVKTLPSVNAAARRRICFPRLKCPRTATL